jgi:hypothetical protein
MSTTSLPLVLVSAWNDSGGGFLHRLFDGHPECWVWPFELQLGTASLHDGFSDWFRAKYRWPDWSSDLASAPADRLFDRFLDDELKGRLAEPATSKFREFDVAVSVDEWRHAFAARLRARTPEGIVDAYLASLFAVWRNRKGSGHERLYLGHCPTIVLDADRILHETPGARMIHVVRRPTGGLADFRLRVPDMDAVVYGRKWSLINTLAFTFAEKYPARVTTVRLDELIDGRPATMRRLCHWLGIAYDPIVETPTWNRTPLARMGPFGGVPVVSATHEEEADASLSADERAVVLAETRAARRLYGME